MTSDLQELNVNSNVEEKPITGLAEATETNIRVGFDKFATKFLYPTNRLAEAFGATPENYFWLKKEEQLKKDIAYKEDKLQNYYNRKDIVTGTSLNLAGSLVQGVADPFNAAINMATGSFGVVGQALMNTAEYLVEENIIYDRTLKDIGTEDIPGLVASIVMPKGAEFIDSKKFKKGELLGDVKFNMDQLDNQGRVYKKPTVGEVMEDLKKRGVDTSDTNKVLDNIQEVSQVLKTINESENLEEMRFLSDYVTNTFGELGDYVREKRILAAWEEVKKTDVEIDLEAPKAEVKPSKIQVAQINKTVNESFKKVESLHYDIDGKRAWSKEAVKNFFEGKNMIPEGETIVDSKPYTSSNYVRGKTGDQYFTYTTARDTTFTVKTVDQNGQYRIREYYLQSDGALTEIPTVQSTRSSLDIVNRAINKENGIIPQNQMADVLNRDLYDGVQGNYGFSSGFERNFDNYLRMARDIDKTIETDLAVKGRTNIKMEREMDIIFKPIKTDIELSLKQLEMEDAQELFGATRNSKPFGNQLYDFAKGWDKQEFINILQSNTENFELDARIRADELRKAGDVAGADEIINQMGTFKILKEKLNYYVGIQSGEGAPVEIGEAFYLNTFYNKREYMQNLNVAVKDMDVEFFNKMSAFIGDDVEINADDIKSMAASMKVLGRESKITTPGVYSLKDFPEEMGILLRNDIESTTRAAAKGAYGEAKTIDVVGKKWGNNRDYSNFANSFLGTENEPYEVVSRIYSTIAKNKLGIDKIQDKILKLTPGMPVGEGTDRSFIQTISDRPIGNYMKQQLEKVNLGGAVDERYKPNFNIDPDDPKLANKVIRRAVKNFMSYKYLTSLNGLKEEGMNKRMGIRGGAQLGWDFKYSQLKENFFKPVESETGFIKAINAIRKENLDSIADPVIKSRAEAFLTKYLANDPIFNDPTKWTLKDTGAESKLLKTADKTLQKLHAVSKKGAWLQSASDAHRTFNAEWLSKNYLMDIIPTMTGNETPLLRKILDSNGIDDTRFGEIKNIIKNLDSDKIDDIIFSGRVAKNDDEYVIQQLFEQFADVLGRKFDPFESAAQGTLGEGFVADQWALFKRFSMGALSRTYNSMSMYYDSDGHLRGRMSGMLDSIRNGEGMKGVKNTLEGSNRMCIGNFAWTAAKFKLATMGISYITGTVAGTVADERVESEVDAISRGEVLPSVVDGIVEQFFNETGINIVFGSKSVLGGFYDQTVKRQRLAASAENLNPAEKVAYFVAAAVLPENLSRGIDNMKFQSSIGTRAYGSGEIAQSLWRSKYRREALYEQSLGQLPIEKVGEFLLGGAISLFSIGKDKRQTYETLNDKSDFEKALKKNPDKAHEIMGTDKRKTPDDLAILGASGALELTKEVMEVQAIGEIMTDNDLLPEQKEVELFNLGLDVDTQARRMKKSDFNTLSAILAYKGIRDQTEILTAMHQFNSTKNKNDFYNEMFLNDDDFNMFESFMANLAAKTEDVNKQINKRKYRVGMNGYLEILDILDNY
ncbi:MAG: hypothetical protein ACRDDY_10645 [Clostridium sp.]|uniref:hypothetical protein n=1 Tax=Clostridium sp. TaxID=1506 RepID=UPI003EE706B6